jgi:hypothetical protein
MRITHPLNQYHMEVFCGNPACGAPIHCMDVMETADCIEIRTFLFGVTASQFMPCHCGHSEHTARWFRQPPPER